MNELQELKKKEKFYFDTYKQNRTNADKAKHLEEMAVIIRKIDLLESKKRNHANK
jgi:hypothetical protein